MYSLTVAQVTGHIRMLLESDPILTDVWVNGEVSNLSRPASGHCYFTLKENTAQLRCAFFKARTTAAAVSALAHGAQVLAHGYVSLYEARGDMQLYVDAVQPAGIGLLQAEYERLLEQLDGEGLFAKERKRPLPAFPDRIGVVTSPTGAVFHDICQVVSRRWPLAEIVLAATPVQGDGAVQGVIAAIERLNARTGIDVIVVARGGGSLEDLWAFNDEGVARAIFASRVPIVSAVGHETDTTIADFVADVRAPTPSAAAELIVPDQIEIAMHVGACAQALSSSVINALTGRQSALAAAAGSLERCRPDPGGLRDVVARMTETMRRTMAHDLTLRSERLSGRTQQLMALSPRGTLERGYALVQTSAGKLLTRAAETRAGEQLSVRMADGSFPARVESSTERHAVARSRSVPSAQSRML